MKYTAVIDGERLDIEITRAGGHTIEAEIGGAKYVVEVGAVGHGAFWFHWKDRSIEVSVTPAREANGQTYVVALGGRRANVEIIDARAAVKKAAQHGQAGAIEVRAPMPGRVVKVLVSEGDEVEMNQGLLVVEAMKMQNEIKSPKKGIVRKLGAGETAAVNAGDLLAVVE